jgi:hypothetical protein
MATYLLIDDDVGDGAAEMYAEALEAASGGKLLVKPLRPCALPQTIQAIAGEKPDGLMLDIALTNALTTDRQHVGFDGISLAQQVRTLQTRGRATGAATLSEFPIIRFSKNDVIREYVSQDPTSDDLFDEMVDKGDVADHAHDVATRALCLADDYPRVVTLTKTDLGDAAIADALGCDPAFVTRLDPRALLGLRRPGAPAHVLARYFTAKLLARPGPLIDEATLAVRLGVDTTRSADWPALTAALGSAAYCGAFSAGYRRWWQSLLMDWWQNNVDADNPPSRVGAEDRVEAICSRTGFRDLTALATNPDSPGLRFWHRCSRSKLPVDPLHGFALLPIYGQETWQDAQYLCLEEARRDLHNPRLAPTERGRLAAMVQGRSAT